MKKRKILLVFLIAVAALASWVYLKRNQPPTVTFAKARRETLVSTLPTNGKIEPLEYAAVRGDTAGLVVKLPVKEGQKVAKGSILAVLNAPELQSQSSAAQARVEQAKGELANIERGGKRAELADIESNLERARLDRGAAQRDYSALKRLEEKQAATHEDVLSAHGKLRQAELEIEALERKRAALVGSSDRAVAQARLREAEADADLARRKISDTMIRSPIDGVVYSLPIRLGSYLNIGDPVADVGVLDRLRVRVYVDEPELGRVARDLPVTITWEAMPGKQWQGVVEKMSTKIQALGTRQVGEVLCTIQNPGHELVPGTNVNAEVRSSVVPNALTIPKEALHRDASGVVGVYVLDSDVIHWHNVRVGSSSISRAQIVEGVVDGAAVALPTDFPVHDGEKVEAAYR